MIPRKQIGFSNEENLLWEISRQLDRAFVVMRTGGTITTTTTSSTTTTTTTLFCENCVEAPVVIGTQTWQKCNLNVDTYANGDLIPEVTDPTVWNTLTTGAWCYYDNNPANGPIYGKLYNWYAVNDPRGLAPVGQHIPTEVEIQSLITELGGDAIAGGKMKETGLCHWVAPNAGATNESGFSAIGGGNINLIGNFDLIQFGGVFWTSTSTGDSTASNFLLLTVQTSVVLTPLTNKKFGLSVRCLID